MDVLSGKRKKKHKSMLQFSSSEEYNNFLTNEKCTFIEKYHKSGSDAKRREDFDLICTLGIGSFGKVVLVQDKIKQHKFYAMKILKKELVVERQQIDHTLSEKRVLQSLNFIFTMYSKYFFMDINCLYFVMPFQAGGELYFHYKNAGVFPEHQARFYAAQVLLGLEYLHNLNLVYRDLKPENVVMDSKGYIKLTDFGFCKLVTGRTYTLCGTPDYIAPEIITAKGYGKAVDFWSFGILVYELCAGFTPFLAPDLMSLYEQILCGKFSHPKTFTRDLKDLTNKLIQTDLSKRLGNLKEGTEGIKIHGWFKSVHWLKLLNGDVEPPLVPEVIDGSDTGNFDPIFTNDFDDSIVENQTDVYKDYFVVF